MRQTRQQTFLVLGLGPTGLSCVQHLHAQGHRVLVNDSREQPPMLTSLRQQLPEVPVYCGEFQLSLASQADVIIASPGLDLRLAPLQEMLSAKPVWGDIELFARQAQQPVLAITGSNGKSTVTTLVGAMCQAAGLKTAVGGNIGTPALSLLQQAQTDVYVLELSSFQLETTHSLNAHAAVVLNISPDHMDRYADINAYAAAKQSIFHGTGTMLLNRDDAVVSAMQLPERRTLWFGLGVPGDDASYGIAEYQGEAWFMRGEHALCACRALRLPGLHNRANALAAIALAQTLGVDQAAIAQALSEFTGLAHRTEWVAKQDGVVWINDSKGTNVGATTAALRGMQQPVVLIAGGEGKGADFSPLREVVRQQARAVILIGRDADLLEQALSGAAALHRAQDLAAAVAQARVLAQPGDIVLLSPACASFDMFRDYQHRGDSFKHEVQQQLGHTAGQS